MGLTKDFFKDNLKGESIAALANDKVSSFCFINESHTDHFEQNVSNFICEINRIKGLYFLDLIFVQSNK